MDINRFIKTHFNSPIQILVLKVAIELLIFKYHNILALKLGFLTLRIKTSLLIRITML